MRCFAYIWIVLILNGCSLDATKTQDIDIDIFSENEKNIKLAEDLMYYDPRYIAHKVPSYNESTAKGIRLGYFVRSNDGKASYQISYRMLVPEISKNIDQLMSEFETFIPELAAFHVSKMDLFEELSPKGNEWASTFHERSAKEIISTGSNFFKESITHEQLTSILKTLSSEFGNPSSTEYIRAQYYEEFADVPESISLYYLQTYSNGKKSSFRVSYYQENGEWAVIGFGVDGLP